MNTFLKVIAVLAGLALVLPGLCTALFGGWFFTSSLTYKDTYGFGQLGLAMLVGGIIAIALGIFIIRAVNRRRD